MVPEGDTIHKAATRLRPALVGQQLTRFTADRLTGTRPRLGEAIEAVEAVGKHLLIRFSGGLTLETHMRMTGSWHLYDPGERWRKPEYLARCVIEVPERVAVCFAAPVMRTFPTTRLGGSADPMGHLGPDLAAPLEGTAKELSPEIIRRCVDRMDEVSSPDRAIGDVLLDQRVANGVGNVYRSEVCWACHVSPFRTLGEVPAGLRAELIVTSAKLLRANLTTRRRTTVPGGLAVYGRRRAQCRRCGGPVRWNNKSENGRVVYWCPGCQD